MDEKLRTILEKGANEIEPSLCNDVLIGRLVKLYDEISLFNPSYKLVAAQGEEIVTRHILDCLAPVTIMKEMTSGLDKVKAADLGSGSGLPGIVLASAFDSWDFSLVERMGRRAGFLRNTLAVVDIANSVQVVQKDLSEVQNSYNVITFRAFRAFKDIVSDLDRILIPGGFVFAYKSSEENIAEELSVLDNYKPGLFDVKIVEYKVPFLDAKRKLLVLHKAILG